MRRIRLFLDDIKKSKGFIILLTVQIILCICLLSMALTQYNVITETSSFYSDKLKDTNYINFVYSDKFKGMSVSVEEASEFVDIDNFATASTFLIRRSEERLTVLSPTVAREMKSLGLAFSETISEEYAEAYVHKDFSDKYSIGEVYTIEVFSIRENYERKVKIKGYYKKDKHYAFGFNYNDIVSTVEKGLIICDNLPKFATIQAGIDFSGKNIDDYAFDNIFALKMSAVYEDLSNNMMYSQFMYLALIAILISVVSVFTNYLLNIDKHKKKMAIKFACGQERGEIIGIEIGKMIFIFAVGMFVNWILTATVGQMRFNAGVLMGMREFLSASAIMLGTYVLSIAVGIVKIFKTKPLDALSSEVIE